MEVESVVDRELIGDDWAWVGVEEIGPGGPKKPGVDLFVDKQVEEFRVVVQFFSLLFYIFNGLLDNGNLMVFDIF